MIPATILLILHATLAFFAIRALRKSRALSLRLRKVHQWLCALLPFLWSLFSLAAIKTKPPEVMASHVRGTVRTDEPHNNSPSPWVS
ncbi:MAG: hypothetical protein MUC87_00890 [Bacteroidia bacterium]|jgi:hypothetical protein|nr:hypothetical protein [Bacteroidia bacterium]